MSVEAQFTLSEDRLYRDEGPESGLKSIKENRVSESSVLILSVSQRLRILSNQSFFAKVCFTTMLTDGSSKWKKFRSWSERRLCPQTVSSPNIIFRGCSERLQWRAAPQPHRGWLEVSNGLIAAIFSAAAMVLTDHPCPTSVQPAKGMF